MNKCLCVSKKVELKDTINGYFEKLTCNKCGKVEEYRLTRANKDILSWREINIIEFATETHLNSMLKEDREQQEGEYIKVIAKLKRLNRNEIN